ncbi:MAG: hypothetical protein SOX92_05060 [Candidatus Onthovivens sp.]|nr:hypothetical protein [Candidatus Onthovivens sp.]
MVINLKYEYDFSDDVIFFIENTILPALNLNELNDDNIDEIGEYAAQIEVDFVDRKGLTKEEKELFKIAVKTVTELSLYNN